MPPEYATLTDAQRTAVLNRYLDANGMDLLEELLSAAGSSVVQVHKCVARHCAAIREALADEVMEQEMAKPSEKRRPPEPEPCSPFVESLARDDWRKRAVAAGANRERLGAP